MRYRFGSREWMAAVHGVFVQRASCLAAAGIKDRVSLCEIYLNTPSEFGWPDNKVAWSAVYENGQVDFRLSERDDVRFKATGDYQAFARLSTYTIDGDPQRLDEYGRMVKAEVDAGRVAVLIGRGFKEPGELEWLHDILARIGEI